MRASASLPQLIWGAPHLPRRHLAKVTRVRVVIDFHGQHQLPLGDEEGRHEIVSVAGAATFAAAPQAGGELEVTRFVVPERVRARVRVRSCCTRAWPVQRSIAAAELLFRTNSPAYLSRCTCPLP